MFSKSWLVSISSLNANKFLDCSALFLSSSALRKVSSPVSFTSFNMSLSAVLAFNSKSSFNGEISTSGLYLESAAALAEE